MFKNLKHYQAIGLLDSVERWLCSKKGHWLCPPPTSRLQAGTPTLTGARIMAWGGLSKPQLGTASSSSNPTHSSLNHSVPVSLCLSASVLVCLFHLSLSLLLFQYLSLSLYVCLCICICLYLSGSVSVSSSVYVSVSVSVSQSLYLSLLLSVSLYLIIHSFVAVKLLMSPFWRTETDNTSVILKFLIFKS